MLQRVLIIANPGSGKGKATYYADQLSNALRQHHHSVTHTRLTKKAGDAKEWARQASQNGYDTVICLGGDGTVNETAQGVYLSEHPIMFGFIPLGTVNDLGRALGYSMNPERAIREFKQVELRKLDIARVNDRYFINVLAIGAVPESVMLTDSKDKNRLGRFAYYKDSIAGLLNTKDYYYQLEIDDATHMIQSNLILIMLTNNVAGFERLFYEARYDDGLIHIVAIDGVKPTDQLNAVFEAAIGETKGHNFIAKSAKKIKIRNLNQSIIYSNVDGDQGPTLPLDIEVIPHAIDVLVPR